MKLYIVVCQALIFAILLVQNQLIKEVAAGKEQAPAVDNWFNSLEKKLNVMPDFFNTIENIFEEVVVDSSDSDISRENDVMHDVFQGARASAWEVVTESIKKHEIIEEEKDVIGKDYEARISYDTLKSRELQENSITQTGVNGENEPEKRAVSSLYLEPGTTAKPRPIRRKKIRKSKRKSNKLKPKRLRPGKTKKAMKTKEHLTKKRRPKKKFIRKEHKYTLPERKPNVSELKVPNNTNRGKPVDIIVHIKMNE